MDLLSAFSRALTEKEERDENDDNADEEEENYNQNSKSENRKLNSGNHLTECLTNCAGTNIVPHLIVESYT